MPHFLIRILIPVLSVVLLASCATAPPPKPKLEEFLTLADLSGRPTLKEDSPDVRVIRVKAKSFIKQNNIRMAKTKALEVATKQAVDEMVRELLPADTYNLKFADIEEYLSKNVDKYVDGSEVNDERRIFGGKYYGIDSAVKVNRQKVLVALQKDLKLINTSSSTLITVVTSKKNLDLSASGFTFSDIENALMNELQTQLNQKGLRAMDHRVAITHMQSDEKLKEQFAKISKEQFMALVSGSPADRALLDQQIQNAEEFYSTGLSLLQQLAKVVVEVNIFTVSGNVKGDLALSLNVTAKSISTGRGGAFANTVVNAARRGGPNTIPSAMITGLVQDAYTDLEREFIPQVIKEMSSISVGGDKLVAYELILKDFSAKEARRMRGKLDEMQSDEFRYISYDNTLQNTQPSLTSIRVRYAGKVERLADKMMGVLDSLGIDSNEPVVAPELTDLVFTRMPAES